MRQTNVYRFFVLLILLMPFTGFGQAYIDLSKKKVRQALEKQRAANSSISISLSETDSSIHYSFRDPKLLPADFIYNFDKNGKCVEEITIAQCDSCFKKYLQKAIGRENLGWKKLKENVYVSKFEKKMMLEIPAGNTPHSFIVRKMKWDRQVYATLIASK